MPCPASRRSGSRSGSSSIWARCRPLSGLIFAARLNAATPKAATLSSWMPSRPVSSAAHRISGGVGTVIGAIIGGLVMGVMNNGMSIIGVSIDWQQAIKGLVLLLAVAFDFYIKNRSQ